MTGTISDQAQELGRKGPIRIGVSVQAKQINLKVRRVPIGGPVRECSSLVERQAGAICILIGVEQYVGAVIFVVAEIKSAGRSMGG